MNRYKEALDELKEVLYLPDKYLEKRLNILQELVEKATPKEPKRGEHIWCSRCGAIIEEYYPEYCSCCGQNIDWSDSNE